MIERGFILLSGSSDFFFLRIIAGTLLQFTRLMSAVQLLTEKRSTKQITPEKYLL